MKTIGHDFHWVLVEASFLIWSLEMTSLEDGNFMFGRP